MGQLFFTTDFQPPNREDFRSRPPKNPLWFFEDACWNRTHYTFTVASSYPEALYVHNDKLTTDIYGDEEKRANAARRVEIRRWIERALEGDVISEKLNMSYYRVWTSSQSVSTIEHHYRKFSFENHAEAVMFRMRFDFAETKTQEHHPKYGPDEDSTLFKDFWKRHEAEDWVYKLKYCTVK